MSAIKRSLTEHPYIITWIILAIAMVAMLLYAAKDVGFSPTQWAAMIVATIGLAGACVWIITWE
jgi:hypothetical protein